MVAAVTHLLYLHGFRSSPRSTKARLTSRWRELQGPDLRWWCPQLPPSPKEAMRLVEAGIADWPAATTCVIGSSLGGFYATALAERTGCRAVLLNPAVNPARDLARHVGEHPAWHGDEVIFFRPEFIAELQALTPAAITRTERYFAVIAKGDEVLDWREMESRYRGCPGLLLEGSDHAIGEYESLLPVIAAFIRSSIA